MPRFRYCSRRSSKTINSNIIELLIKPIHSLATSKRYVLCTTSASCLLGCIWEVGSYVQNGENDSRSSKEKKGLKRISSLIIAGSDMPEIFQATKTALYYIPALVSLPVIFPGMKQILDRRDGVLGTLLSKVKSNFLCPIRPIAQNVAALDFSKLLQKRDGLITISTVTSR